MKSKFFIEVKARIQVEAAFETDAELLADELVDGGKVNIVELALQAGPNTDYSKECVVVMFEDSIR